MLDVVSRSVVWTCYRHFRFRPVVVGYRMGLDTEALLETITRDVTAAGRSKEFQHLVWARIAAALSTVASANTVDDAIVPPSMAYLAQQAEEYAAFVLQFVVRRERYIEELEGRVESLMQRGQDLLSLLDAVVPPGGTVDITTPGTPPRRAMTFVAPSAPEMERRPRGTSFAYPHQRGGPRMYRGLSGNSKTNVPLGGSTRAVAAGDDSVVVTGADLSTSQRATLEPSSIDHAVVSADIAALEERCRTLQLLIDSGGEVAKTRFSTGTCTEVTDTTDRGSSTFELEQRVLMARHDVGVSVTVEPCRHLLLEAIADRLPRFRCDSWLRGRARLLLCQATIAQSVASPGVAARVATAAYMRYAAVCERQLAFAEHVIEHDARPFDHHGHYYAAMIADWMGRRALLRERLHDAMNQTTEFVFACARLMNSQPATAAGLRASAAIFESFRHNSPQRAGPAATQLIIRQWAETARRHKRRKPRLFVSTLDAKRLGESGSGGAELPAPCVSPPPSTALPTNTYEGVAPRVFHGMSFSSRHREKIWDSAVPSSGSKWAHVAVSAPDEKQHHSSSPHHSGVNASDVTVAAAGSLVGPPPQRHEAVLRLPLVHSPPITARQQVSSFSPRQPHASGQQASTARVPVASRLRRPEDAEPEIVRPTVPCSACVTARATRQERECSDPECAFGYERYRMKRLLTQASEGAPSSPPRPPPGGMPQNARTPAKSTVVPARRGLDLGLGPV
jgi:hypothetical protein